MRVQVPATSFDEGQQGVVLPTWLPFGGHVVMLIDRADWPGGTCSLRLDAGVTGLGCRATQPARASWAAVADGTSQPICYTTATR